MFRQIRFQTGELKEIASEMKKGTIPAMDVDDMEEFEHFAARLEGVGIYRIGNIPYDKYAQDRVKEPEFEFRAAFSLHPGTETGSIPETKMYLDVFFEPEPEDTYDSVDEI